MNETTKDKTKGGKVGADGLSKKERRALKVTEKGGPKSVAEIPKTNTPPKTNVKLPQKASEQTKQKEIVPAVTKQLEAIKIKPEKPVETKDANKDNTDVGHSKAQLKAERRALQEKQRLAKLAATQEVKKPTTTTNKLDCPKVVTKKTTPVKIVPVKPVQNMHQVQLFNHLYLTEPANHSQILIENVHPAFVKLAVQYSSKTILGSNARCLALLTAVKSLINDFVTPPKQELCRSMEQSLQNCVDHLQKSRKFSVSMTNALRHFKVKLTQVNTSLEDGSKKSDLLTIIDDYIRDEIAKAGEAISINAREKIKNGDVILTYGCSSLIRTILLDAHLAHIHFTVVIIDGRPALEGREMLRVLLSAGIHCLYAPISALCAVMQGVGGGGVNMPGPVSLVLVGAHALLANGAVLSRTGTAPVAMIAHANNKPVLVCCETYKFCERAQTDAYVYNELGDPDLLTCVDTLDEPTPLTNWNNIQFLTPLNLLYDVTPPEYVTAVVTELGLLPCTSVPVILRIKQTEIS